MSGCSRIASTATLSPWTTLKTPSGTPASLSSSARKIDADGSFSEGLRMNVFPHAIALAEHPHRDHRREVERRDARDDAERLADLVDVDAGRGLLAVAALQQVADAGRELEVLEAARDLAERVGGHLAVLGGQVRRELMAMRLDEVADAEEDLGAARERRRAPGREGRLRTGDRSIDLVRAREVDRSGLPSRGRVVHGTGAA